MRDSQLREESTAPPKDMVKSYWIVRTGSSVESIIWEARRETEGQLGCEVGYIRERRWSYNFLGAKEQSEEERDQRELRREGRGEENELTVSGSRRILELDPAVARLSQAWVVMKPPFSSTGGGGSDDDHFLSLRNANLRWRRVSGGTPGATVLSSRASTAPRSKRTRSLSTKL